MAGKTFSFKIIKQDGKRVRTLKLKTMDAIYEAYKNCALSKGYSKPVNCQQSFGLMAWQNDDGERLFLVKDC